eukprot:1400828-Rhodomonas_salina.1
MLLQAGADGTTSLVRTLEYNVRAAEVVERIMGNVIAIEVEARLSVSAEEACLPQDRLRELCAERLQSALAPHASTISTVQCVSVRVENANCDDESARRAGSEPVLVVDAVIALEAGPNAFLDMDAAVSAGGVLDIKQTAGQVPT